MASVSRDELFDPEFLDSLNGLRILASRVPAAGRYAEQRSQDLGSGTDFRDFRSYSPGDEFRSIDWNIYQRLGKVFLRLFEELEDLPLYLMPDMSQSMFLEQPPRAAAALKISMALAHISLNQHDTVAVIPYSDDAEMIMRPTAGKTQLMRVAHCLADLQPGGGTNLGQALSRLATMRLRSGLLAVVSDFFDPQGVEAITQALQQVRHRLLLIQLIRPADRRPDVAGDVRLVDCETGNAQDVSVNARVIERYQRAYDEYQEKLTAFASRRGAGLIKIDVQEDLIPQLASLFESGSFLV